MARKPRQRSKPVFKGPVEPAPVAASEQTYLATELGHPSDHEGEPAGLDIPTRTNPDFREFTLALWRDVQSSRSLQGQLREMEQEGLAAVDIWAPGITEFLPTTSSAEEVRRYKQKLLFRANVLEAALMETVGELKALERVKPQEPRKSSR